MQDKTRYEEWLTTIANTRLIFNTMAELEDMLDNHSIHSNGIRRCYGTPQKLRAAYRDLMVEVALMTDENIHLDRFLRLYKAAWAFYSRHLARRAHPERTAMEILAFCYPPYRREGLGQKKQATYAKIAEEGVSVPILLMLLMRALPGYDSKEGDATDMEERYAQTLALLEMFTQADNNHEALPAIRRAKGEERKSRVLLYYYICLILDVFQSLKETGGLYDISASTKSQLVELDIEGIWNECGGRAESTSFWQIEKATNEGTYFALRWHKDADGKLTGVKYTCNLLDNGAGELIACITHPEAMKRRIEKISLTDADNAFYRLELTTSQTEITGMELQRDLVSELWPLTLSLTRVTDQSLIETYLGWMHSCKRQLRYAEYDYTFYFTLHAITADYLYIATDVEGEFFRVPKASYEGLEKIQFGDIVGIMTMGGQLYIVFDELMLYIKATPQGLKKYGIDRVKGIIF